MKTTVYALLASICIASARGEHITRDEKPAFELRANVDSDVGSASDSNAHKRKFLTRDVKSTFELRDKTESIFAEVDSDGDVVSVSDAPKRKRITREETPVFKQPKLDQGAARDANADLAVLDESSNKELAVLDESSNKELSRSRTSVCEGQLFASNQAAYDFFLGHCETEFLGDHASCSTLVDDVFVGKYDVRNFVEPITPDSDLCRQIDDIIEPNTANLRAELLNDDIGDEVASLMERRSELDKSLTSKSRRRGGKR